MTKTSEKGAAGKIVTENTGVRQKIEAFELFNEEQRKLKSGNTDTSSPVVGRRKKNTIEKGVQKGGINKTPVRRRPKFKPQKLTLKHFLGPERNAASDQNESN